MPKACARHILVATEEACMKLKNEIIAGLDFADAAKKFSQCPSGRKGGDLGEFFRGQMVPEFDQIVFTEPLGEVLGPVKTDFGYHLIEILDRS
jgi:peptidyl-prolyl cis-trans isomerase C